MSPLSFPGPGSLLRTCHASYKPWLDLRGPRSSVAMGLLLSSPPRPRLGRRATSRSGRRPSWDCRGLPIVAVMLLCVPGQGTHWLGPLAAPSPHWLHFDSGARGLAAGPFLRAGGSGTHPLGVFCFLWRTARQRGLQGLSPE